jgi:hypothetical protein
LYKECLYVEGQHFEFILWSVNCKYFIPNVISQQAYQFIDKIYMHLTASGTLVTVKRRAMNQSIKLRTSPYLYMQLIN